MIDFAAVRLRLLSDLQDNARALEAFNLAAPAELRITGVDLTPGDAVVQPAPAVDGITEIRADGACRLAGRDRRIAEAAASGDSKREAWAAKAGARPWAFIAAALDVPGLSEQQRFNISSNIANAQFCVARFCYDSSDTPIRKRGHTWEAYSFTPSTTGALWVQGERILDAVAFGQSTAAGFSGPVPAEAYRYAEFEEAREIASQPHGGVAPIIGNLKP